jgi:hypothetical protein
MRMLGVLKFISIVYVLRLVRGIQWFYTAHKARYVGTEGTAHGALQPIINTLYYYLKILRVCYANL